MRAPSRELWDRWLVVVVIPLLRTVMAPSRWCRCPALKGSVVVILLLERLTLLGEVLAKGIVVPHRRHQLGLRPSPVVAAPSGSSLPLWG